MNISHPQFCQIDQLVRKVMKGMLTVEQFQQQLLMIPVQWPLDLSPQYEYGQSILIINAAFYFVLNQGLNPSQPAYFQVVHDYILNHGKGIFKKDAEYQRGEIKNQNSLQTYLKKLLNHYARLLFVRIDFAIKKEHQHEIALNQFQAYLQVMSNRYSNQDGCFSGLQGHAWAIEEGFDKGLHCHTLLIYDGNKHQNDFGLGLQVAQYWVELTQGKGCCFISNAPEYKQQFEQQGTLGIGMIHRTNSQQVQNALNTAMYLVNPEKELQHLRIRLPRMRTFGTGQFAIQKRRGID
jgi:hypothetical protein